MVGPIRSFFSCCYSGRFTRTIRMNGFLKGFFFSYTSCAFYLACYLDLYAAPESRFCPPLLCVEYTWIVYFSWIKIVFRSLSKCSHTWTNEKVNLIVKTVSHFNLAQSSVRRFYFGASVLVWQSVWLGACATVQCDGRWRVWSLLLRVVNSIHDERTYVLWLRMSEWMASYVTRPFAVQIRYLITTVFTSVESRRMLFLLLLLLFTFIV